MHGRPWQWGIPAWPLGDEAGNPVYIFTEPRPGCRMAPGEMADPPVSVQVGPAVFLLAGPCPARRPPSRCRCSPSRTARTRARCAARRRRPPVLGPRRPGPTAGALPEPAAGLTCGSRGSPAALSALGGHVAHPSRSMARPLAPACGPAAPCRPAAAPLFALRPGRRSRASPPTPSDRPSPAAPAVAGSTRSTRPGTPAGEVRDST